MSWVLEYHDMSGHDNRQFKSLVAANIKAAISGKDLSRAEVARRLGLGEKTVLRWCDPNVEILPNSANMIRLALLLEREVAWFYTDHDAQPTPEAA